MKKRQLESPKRGAFLAAYRELGNIAHAARIAGRARQSTIGGWRTWNMPRPLRQGASL